MPPEPAPEPTPGPIRPLPLVIALVILAAVGLGLWYILSRPVPLPGGLGEASSTPQGMLGKQHIVDNGQYYEIDAAYPGETPLAESAGTAADQKAVASMKAFETQEIARFKEDSGLLHLTPEDIQIQGLSADRHYALGIDYTPYASTLTLSFVYLIYADTLGAHPNAYYRTFTFDAKTGAELSLKDVFASADYLSVLSNESRTRLPALIKSNSGYDPDMSMLEAGTTAEAANFQNFYLDGSDLVLIFEPYQIAAYALGTTELRIPRTELGNALKAQFR